MSDFILPGVLISIALILIFMIFFLRLGAVVSYGDGDVTAYARVGLIKYRLYPRKERKPRKERPEKKRTAKKQQKKKKKTFLDFNQIMVYIREFSKIPLKLLRMIRIDKLALSLEVATDDAADTALTFGRYCAIVSAALPLLENSIRVKKKDIAVWPAFDKQTTSVAVFISVSTTLNRMIAIALLTAYLFFKIKQRENTARKDTAVKK